MRWIRPGSALCLLAAALALAAQENPVEGESVAAIHMQEHLLRITDIKAAIVAGDLKAIRAPALWLAEHEPLPDLPLIYEPFLLSLRRNALRMVDAEDVVTAAAGVSAIARNCAGCHLASNVDLKFGFDQEPPAWSDLQSHMQRHQWAVDRLWEGLIGPSDGAWSRGITMLAEAPLHGTEASWDDEASGGDALAYRVHLLGRQAIAALTPESRSAIYGTLLGVCAECHTRTGGGPRP